VDGQVVEIIGRNRLIEQLLGAGIEVATPLRDRGIDLIAYRNNEADLSSIDYVPIQVKASRDPAFGVHRKYAAHSGLMIVHIWNVLSRTDCVCYATSYAQTFAIANALGWTGGPSWQQTNSYSTRRPSRRLLELLEPHRMDESAWLRLLEQ
jgi:hypothetical protein